MPRLPLRSLIAAVLLAGALPAVALHAAPAQARPSRALIRVNEVGYVADAPKFAVLMSAARLRRAGFELVDARSRRVVLRGALGRSRGRWNRSWRYVYRLDFSRAQTPGAYVLVVGRARSAPLRIAPAATLYGPLITDAVSYFASERDGPLVVPGPLRRRPSHLLDESATVYRTPRFAATDLRGRLVATTVHLDASGGWFDAGDYLKFAQTTSFADVLLALTLRDHGAALPAAGALRDEVRQGTDWLLRMWDSRARVLYDQVGVGDGNGTTIDGDHDLWRLPQADDRRRARPGSLDYYTSHRPVFAANAPGRPISPNLAGRVAAAFALCAQVFATIDPAYAQRCLLAGQTLYDQADTHPRGLVTSQPHAYYDETEWRDDMELGGAELYLATQAIGPATPGLPHQDLGYYLNAAGHWANAYINGPSAGSDSLNLYDVSTLADADLIAILGSPEGQLLVNEDPNVDVPTSPAAMLRDRADQLHLGERLAGRDAFGLANPSTNVDTVPHALGYAIEARSYDQLTHTSTFERFAQSELGWVLGANAWGSSFVVGAGRTFPHCLADQIANLSGSLSGHGAIMRGATVDGPTAPENLAGLGAPDGFRRCPRGGRDPLGALDSPALAYRDDVRSSASAEPAIDFSALTLLAAAQQAG